MKKFTEAQKVLVVQFFYNIYFWVSIAVPFLIWRGLNLQEALSVMAIYQIVVVLLEYPTGVVGDYFGHKASVFTGLVFCIFSMISLLFPLPKNLYFLPIILIALSSSFISGSMEALLRSVSLNFKEDYTIFKSMSDFILFFVAVLGTLLFSIHPLLPISTSLLFFVIGTILCLTIRVESKQNEKIETGNIFQHAFLGAKKALTDKLIFKILVISSLIGGYAFSLKSIFGSVEEVLKIPDVRIVGVLVGAGMLIRGFGKKNAFSIRFSNLQLIIFLILPILISSLFLHNFLIVLSILNSTFWLGALQSRIGFDLNNLTDDKYRAGTLSLDNLLRRGLSAVIIFISGILISGGNGFAKLGIFVSVLLLVVLILIARDVFQKPGETLSDK